MKYVAVLVALAVAAVLVWFGVVQPRLDDDRDVAHLSEVSPEIAEARAKCVSPPPDLFHQARITEAVGGLVTDDYTVRYSRTSPIGVIALVTGDVETAETELLHEYGVAVVIPWDPDIEEVSVDGLQQVTAVLEERCPSE